MSNIVINIDSSLIKNQATHNFEIPMNPPIYLNPNKNYLISLYNGSLWYSWTNISVSQGNNTLKYGVPIGVFPDGGTTKTITFPDGAYTIDAINEEIKDQMLKNGHTYIENDEVKSQLVFQPNYATLKIQCYLYHGYTLDLSEGLLYKLLGFEATQYSQALTTAPYEADISNGINSILIHCNLVKNSFINGGETDVIFSTIPQVPPGSMITLIPQKPIELLLNTNAIHSIKMRVTDGANRELDLGGEDVNYCLVIREDK